jgi:hypothetical protein
MHLRAVRVAFEGGERYLIVIVFMSSGFCRKGKLVQPSFFFGNWIRIRSISSDDSSSSSCDFMSAAAADWPRPPSMADTYGGQKFCTNRFGCCWVDGRALIIQSTCHLPLAPPRPNAVEIVAKDGTVYSTTKSTEVDL